MTAKAPYVALMFKLPGVVTQHRLVVTKVGDKEPGSYTIEKRTKDAMGDVCWVQEYYLNDEDDMGMQYAVAVVDELLRVLNERQDTEHAKGV